jgi:hypothetical protein
MEAQASTAREPSGRDRCGPRSVHSPFLAGGARAAHPRALAPIATIRPGGARKEA